MRLACAIILFVGARAAGVAPAETLSSAVPAGQKNPIDAVEATYGRVKQRWRDYLKPKPKNVDAPAEKSNPFPFPAHVLSNTVTVGLSPARPRSPRRTSARPR